MHKIDISELFLLEFYSKEHEILIVKYHIRKNNLYSEISVHGTEQVLRNAAYSCESKAEQNQITRWNLLATLFYI